MIWAVVFATISVLLYHWGNTKMDQALRRISELTQKASESVACKCKEPKNPDVPCKDVDEESFRQAYKRLNKSFIQASSQVKDLEMRLQVTEMKTQEYLEALCQRVQALESYSENAVGMMDPYTRNKFIAKFGNPPVSTKIS